MQTGYGDGITNDGDSFGHWFGDQRAFGDALGGRSNMLRVGWEPAIGGLVETQLRMLANDSLYNYGGPGWRTATNTWGPSRTPIRGATMSSAANSTRGATFSACITPASPRSCATAMR